MGLNRKDIDLLEEINGKILPLKYFAEKYSVSERNIRYSIDNINFYLRKENLDEIEIKKGSLVFSTDEKNLNFLIKNLDMVTYTFSQEERESYILTKYLFEENVTLKEIELFLNVSRTTIKKDLKNVEKQISYFELYFLRDGNKIEISGNEKKLRHLKLLKLLDYIEVKDKEIFIFSKKYLNEKIESQIIEKYINKYYEKNIPESIYEIEEKFGTEFPEQFKNIITLYLTVTIERMSNKYIINRKINSEFLKTLDEYKIIQKVLDKIIDIKLEYEMLHLLEYFLSGQYVNYFYENFFIAEKFINRLLRALEKDMNKKFSTSRELTEKLLKYLIPAIYRIKNNFKLYKNLEARKIKIDEKIFEKVKKAVSENNKYLLEPLRDEETVYIAECIESYLHYNNIKKISLKELTEIIKKNSLEANMENITEEIREKFDILIEDDINCKNENILPELLKINRIYLTEEELKFTEAVKIGINLLVKDGCAKDRMFVKLKDLAGNYGRYMFIEKGILFCYNTDNEDYLKEGLSVVISKNGIKVEEGEKGYVLFVLSIKNKREYLKIISELMDLSEKKIFLKNLIIAESNDEALEIILKSI